MEKEELRQLYYLNKEVIHLKKRLKELENVSISENPSVHITGMPSGRGISDKVSRYSLEMEYLEDLISQKISECWQEIKRLNEYINSIQDSTLRQIFTLRYINAFTWQQIAFAIGESDESYPRRKHNAFLKAEKKTKNSLPKMPK
ncbi:MAG: DUF1492 domain-containing protein [Aminipila sp.]